MFQVVAMQEELDGDFVHFGAFGKRKGLAHESPEALAQGVVEAFDMVGGAFGVRGLMLAGRQDVVITLQMIRIQRALTVSRWDTRPKEPGGGVIAWPQGIRDDLAGAPAEGQPQPDHSTPAMTHKSPQFIQFQDIIRLSSGQGRLQRRHPQGFFFSQAVTVLRDTPKVRLSPRRLLRSW